MQSQRLKDGSWSFTCERPMDDCVRLAQKKCPNQRFRILDGTSETRVRDALPYEETYHTSRLRLVCTNDGATVLFSLDGPQPLQSQAQPRGVKATLCTRGQTRECVGPGACKGGQMCLPDGTGFGACDCGPTTPDPSAAPPGPSPPAPAPEFVPSGVPSAAPPASSP